MGISWQTGYSQKVIIIVLLLNKPKSGGSPCIRQRQIKGAPKTACHGINKRSLIPAAIKWGIKIKKPKMVPKFGL